MAPTLDPIVFRLWPSLHTVSRKPRLVHRLGTGTGLWVPDRDAHLHETATLVLCVAGMLRIQHWDGGTDLGPGEALAIEGGAWHAHVPARAGTITYEHKLIDRRATWSLHDERHYGGQFAIPPEPSRGLLDRILAEAAPAARCRLLTRLVDATTEVINEMPLWETPLQEMWNAVWRGLGRKITAADVLAASGLSARHAQRCFTAHFGETPKQMILRCQLELAKAHLRHGASVTEAAKAAGFRNRTDLTRNWRHRHGAPPRSWDKQG